MTFLASASEAPLASYVPTHFKEEPFGSGETLIVE